MTTFTPHQDSALKAVADWMKAKPGRNGTPPVFRLFGYAGTGKTTLARHIADGVDGEVKFAAFTGKAALGMRNKGCDNASTIHSLIYRARESGVEQPGCSGGEKTPAAPTTCGYGRSKTSKIHCRSPATSWCACATTARRACSMAGCGG